VCVTMPGRVVAVDADGATVETAGRVRRASTLLHPEVEVGEWVVVAAGTVIERLDDADAALIRQALLDASLPTTPLERGTGASDGIDP
jgi:hydrogenase assembly chaperone HypC/HupF